MPLMDITNPDVIKFLIESYDKTARLRMKWNNLHGAQLQHAATLQREEKGYYEADVTKAAMAAGMPTITRDFITGNRNKRVKPVRDGPILGSANMRKGHSIADVGLGDPEIDPRLARPDDDFTIDPIMRPVDPMQKEIIYKGVPYFGRQVYLKSRNKIKPENKFYFSQSSGWDYGWRLGDSYFGKTAPQFGRVWRLTKDLKGRSGPHPDPPHYRSGDIPTSTKCVI